MKEDHSILQWISSREGIELKELEKLVNSGEVVILNNPRHKGLEPCAVGKMMPTRINLNLGMSPGASSYQEEIKKLETAIRLGADAVMDLSLGQGMDEMRKALIAASTVPLGTVPIYQAAYEKQLKGELNSLQWEDLFKVIQKQAEEGVDFVTVHTGLTRAALEHVKRDRILGVVSRGGSILASWMYANKKENPLYEHYDELLDLTSEYSLTLSLGDGLRPGCIDDGSDRAQFTELLALGDQVRRARERGVKVIVEGPGHIRMDEIEMNILAQKKICQGVPFYILGPLVTDIAPGYDHITSAIGSAIAAASGADFICCVTPAEHLGLPDLQDIEDGVIAGKIAAHAADLVKGNVRAQSRDLEMARARKELNWQKQFALALNPEKAARVYAEKNPNKNESCSMCGEMCAILLYKKGEGNSEGNGCRRNGHN